jgi:hypothetical protein
MTPEEFRSARLRLGWTSDEIAAEYRLTPRMVTAIEDGSLGVPRDVATDLQWRIAVAEREIILDQSGLPPCEVAEDIDRRAATHTGNQLLESLRSLNRHAETCETCQALSTYLQEHAPPLPELPLPWFAHVFGILQGLVERLPAPVRPPPAPEGEYRRVGVFVAAGFSLIAIALLGLATAAELLRGTASWREFGEALRMILFLVPAYFVGFWLAGTAFDASRRIAHRIEGYVLRGSLGLASVYGAVGVVLPLVDPEFESWLFVLALTAGFAVLGAVGRAANWAFDRIRGKLRDPASYG